MKRLVLAVLCLSGASQARVLSYSPVTDRTVTPAVQHRTNRHYALIEVEASSGGPSFVPCSFAAPGRLVVYDASGAEEPRTVFPPSGEARIYAAAAQESGAALRLLVQTDADVGGGPGGSRTLYSPDGGATWIRVGIPAVAFPTYGGADVGGPLA